ncbi:hypothetical protein [Aestuariivita boseongensis]|uniref:hypothetical protein n=1 Tax=Aestuariivita boseongensis TaxID=1470562 RepID=UPI000681F98C|nr:hypothetical protein [Aestuariivita boseongensis]
MVQNNKILTVSYGTFSCTLEGFDDAFGTMKAIAEYFRDLAADDRYFGAEPPQPDVEMLAHIAQKEVARRVEAHQDQSGIVLRAREAAEALAVPAAAAAAAEAARAAPQDEAEAELVADDQETAVSEPEVEDVSDAILAELSAAEDEEPVAELEEPVAEAEEPETEAEEPVAEAEEPVAEAEEPVAEVEEPVAEVEEPATEEPVAETREEEAEDDAAAFFAMTEDDMAEEELAEEVEEVVAEEAAPEPEAETPAADSIAAKLQRIRAVVSKGNAKEAREDFSEDEHADPIDTPSETVDAKDKISALLSGLYAKDEAEEEDTEEQEFLDDVNDRLDALDPADDAEDEGEADLVAEAVQEDIAEDAPEDVDEEEPAPAQARVVKVSKEDFDAILASDRGEDLPTVDLSDMMDEEDEDDAEFESSLSPEDEEDLMRELAEVQAEAQEEDLEDDEDDVDSLFADAAESDEDYDFAFEDDDEDEDEDHAILSDDVDSDENVSRLLDEAGDKLSDSETSDRRSEFAHLRAAMAAGKAEEAAGGSMSDAASDNAYREDLARVVKPRRPESDDTRERSRRPQDEKPAPLKLVAAQRIDAEPAPVQPRRVMSAQMEDMGDDGADGKMKFADYAEQVGAHDLPDLLEAAAAYLSFVEGQEQFSRPQLMTKVRMVETQEFSREDGLRSFGLLLRDGKIEKTQAGRFTVSDRIGFRPEDMRAAG